MGGTVTGTSLTFCEIHQNASYQSAACPRVAPSPPPVPQHSNRTSFRTIICGVAVSCLFVIYRMGWLAVPYDKN